jgi:hypothetical protein
MHPLEIYLEELAAIRASGAATKETSGYPALANLLNATGHTLKPKVRCLIQLKNHGAGLPDGGLFAPDQLKQADEDQPLLGQLPARGVIEVKSTQDEIADLAETQQVKDYLARYGLVLLTNYREFLLLKRAPGGKAQHLEFFRLAATEAAFWTAAAHPRQTAAELGERGLEYLKRVILDDSLRGFASPSSSRWNSSFRAGKIIRAMKPPDEFIEEYWKMRERMDWAQAGLGRDQDLAQGKTVLGEFREFFEKWHPVITIPELREGLEEMHAQLEKTLGWHLEGIFLAHLHEVIEARKDWWTGEELLKMAATFINLMKHAPPQLRPGLEEIHRDFMKKDFDPETYYRDSVAEAATVEAEFRQALVELAVDWPERVDAALRARLEKLDGPAANAWQAEVAALMEAAEKKSN